MTTAKKLWLGFGTLTAILLLFGVPLIIHLVSIAKNIQVLVEIDRPRMDASRELQLNVVEYALAVRSFTETRVPLFRQEAEEHVGKVEHARTEYEHFMATDQQRNLAARFDADWQAVYQRGQALITAENLSNVKEKMAAFAEMRGKLEQFFDDEMKADAAASYNTQKERTLQDVRSIIGLSLMLMGGCFVLAVTTSLIVGRDIVGTDRLLNESETKYRFLHEGIRDAFSSVNMDGRLLEFNRAYLDLLGYTADELRERTYLDLTPAKWHEMEARIVAEQVLARGFSDVYEKEYRRKDGSIVPIELRRYLVREARNQPAKMCAIVRDISDRKQVEAALKRSAETLEEQIAARTLALHEREERLQAILNAAADSIITIDAKGIVQSVNAATERMLGFTAAEMIGQNIKMLMPAPYRDEHDRYLESYDRTGVKKIIGICREVFAQRKDGSTIPIELTVSEVDHLHLFTGILRDITESKQSEAALHESERFARSTLDGLSAHIAIVSEEGTILAVNNAWRALAAANGARPEAVQEGANYLSACDRSIGLYAENGPFVAAGIRAVLSGHVTEFVADYPCLGPKEERWFHVRATPFPGAGPRRVVVAHEDITKRKQLEREVVEIASREQRRIGDDLHDSVGQELTALNLLAVDLAELLRINPLGAPKLVERMIQGLHRSQQELRSVMRGLLPVAVDSEGLMAALSDLADRVQQEGKATCAFDCAEPVSVADNLTATHLYLIAQEAVHNAVKHAQPENIQISLLANDRLMLRVQDDGKGIPVLPTEKYSGLGLRIMHNRAAIIGAALTIERAEPQGTVVTCTLAAPK